MTNLANLALFWGKWAGLAGRSKRTPVFWFFNFSGCRIFILCKIHPITWKNQNGLFVKLSCEQFRMLEKFKEKLGKRVFYLIYKFRKCGYEMAKIKRYGSWAVRPWKQWTCFWFGLAYLLAMTLIHDKQQKYNFAVLCYYIHTDFVEKMK